MIKPQEGAKSVDVPVRAVTVIKQKEGGEAIDVNWLERLISGPKRGVFKVINSASRWNVQGTGAFYEAVDQRSRKRALFMTCNHVLFSTSRNEILKVTFESESIQQLKQFKFEKEHILRCWTDSDLDATVIELTSKGEQYFRQNQVEFIKIGVPELKARIAIFQFPKGEFKFANGRIMHIQDSKIMYRIATAGGSSGSPLLNLNCEAVGIHYEGEKSYDPSVPETELPELERTASSLI